MEAEKNSLFYNKLIHYVYLIFISILIGVITSLIAIAFIYSYKFFHNLFFYGELSFSYNPNYYAKKSGLGAGIIFIPVIGAIIVTFLITKFSYDAKGSGIPQVMKSIIIKKGEISPVVGIIKFISSSISLGSGGSIGIEGPITLIGGSIGSQFSKIKTFCLKEKRALIAAGAASGISTVFDTPIAGFLFAMELLLVKTTSKNLLPLAIAVATAHYISNYFPFIHPFLENRTHISFAQINFSFINSIHFYDIILLIFLGIISGLISILFIRTLYLTEDLFNKISKNYYIRHAIAMLIVGIMIYLFMRFSGHYHIQGVSHATIIEIFLNTISSPTFLMLLFGGKFLATCLTLGTGASGGVFSPTLFMGACVGGVYAILIQNFIPNVEINSSYYVLAAMAGMLSGVTGAVLTGIIMPIELSNSLEIIIFVLISSVTSYFIRKLFCYDNVYTLNLRRQGINYPYSL